MCVRVIVGGKGEGGGQSHGWEHRTGACDAKRGTKCRGKTREHLLSVVSRVAAVSTYLYVKLKSEAWPLDSALELQRADGLERRGIVERSRNTTTMLIIDAKARCSVLENAPTV